MSGGNTCPGIYCLSGLLFAAIRLSLSHESQYRYVGSLCSFPIDQYICRLFHFFT